MKSFKYAILLIFLSLSVHGQDFSQPNFLKMYLNRDNYELENFQCDTLLQSKIDFLNRLKKFDSKSYSDLEDFMQLNEHKFPQLFFITDIDSDGIKEYFIRENYEGTLNLCYTFKNGKPVRFLKDIPFQIFLIENLNKNWLVARDSYLGWSRSYELLGMIANIYCFNFINLENNYKFRLYESYQVPFSTSNLPHLDLELPKKYHSPLSIVLNSSSRFYSNYSLPKNYQNTGIINKGSYGWVITDTLNSYFAIFDTTTCYQNDSLGLEKITYKDRGYLFCWIPKKVADFSILSPISGIYKDISTNEYLRIVETTNNIIVNYFSAKSFEKTLKVDTFERNENKLIVKFQSSNDRYILIIGNNNNEIKCVNPNKSEQLFKRIK
jgi:hypothetical protein